MTDNDQYSITQRVDAAWMIAMCIAIHGGEPPHDWSEDTETYTMAHELAGRLGQRYGRTDDLDSALKRLAALGIQVEINAADCTGVSTLNSDDPYQAQRHCIRGLTLGSAQTDQIPPRLCIKFKPQKDHVAS